jgi:hypothetical protein
MLRGPRRVGGCDPDSPAHQLTRTMLDGGWRAHGTRKLAELLDLLPLLDPRHHADLPRRSIVSAVGFPPRWDSTEAMPRGRPAFVSTGSEEWADAFLCAETTPASAIQSHLWPYSFGDSDASLYDHRGHRRSVGGCPGRSGPAARPGQARESEVF